MNEEDALLAAIQAAPTEDLPRLVYADWLEEHDRDGSEFLRIGCELAALLPTDPRRDELQVRLREAGLGIDPDWIAAVSRAPVEGCEVMFQFEYQCPKQWEKLQPTADESVRFCDECRKNVFFCTSMQVARTHATLGECVAVDSRLTRRPNDLEPPGRELSTVMMGMLVEIPALNEMFLKSMEPPPPPT